ncbi:chromate efflux transporter [Alkalihalobacillus pseudalcaliphilus]|uniref:chromate efflux transporter n=1 Tax=Alkalihalobacillus pseudalcaliphilus TaxID=79884 RepID=UPI000A552389|nr:chromate efflux transporter [Alkalihalobacillus pseudalcaliphilus]
MFYIQKLWQIFMISTRLGLTSFGGPVAHLSYFHEEYVRRKKWLSEKDYADLVALAQFLPGPASSQVGIGIGVMRAGVIGGIISFIGFTFPSVLVLILFALYAGQAGFIELGFIQGLKVVAVVVVAHAIIGMAKTLTPDLNRKLVALSALLATLLLPYTFTQVAVIAVAAIIGLLFFQEKVPTGQKSELRLSISKMWGALCLGLFFLLLIGLPILQQLFSSNWLAMVDSFYRAGSLVFGGGHVVLPLLEREFVPTGLISEADFLAGYGATQAVPGPLFTFAAYIGAVQSGWLGGIVATLAIFTPAFLLILGALPFWNELRQNKKASAALLGVNAAVVGILISAFYQPIWTSAIVGVEDFALAATLFALLVFVKVPAWAIVLLGALGGLLLGWL